MDGNTTCNIAPADYDADNDFLTRYDEMIQRAARKALPHGIFAEDVRDLEIDELAQQIRIKLWHAYMKKRAIVHPKAYIYITAYTLAIDMLRRHKQTVPLAVDEYGELPYNNLFATQDEELQDPAWLVEKAETFNEYLISIGSAITGLPPRQKMVMIYHLKDILEDVALFEEVLATYEIDVENMHWPATKVEEHRLKASLSAALKKMRSLLQQIDKGTH